MDKQAMYILGQICRAIWPGGSRHQDNPPTNIIDIVLTRPASGLAMMIKHSANAKSKQRDIGDLVDKLADIRDPPGGVKASDQAPFWLGYYHYAAAIAAAKNYGTDELTAAGRALYGDRWQTDLARDLSLSGARRIRQWLSKDRPIPVGIWADVAGLLRQRQMSIGQVLADLTQE